MIRHDHRRPGGYWPAAWASVLGLVFLGAGGCSRAFYRRQADREAYTLVDCATDDPRWPLEGYTIEPDPRSRMFNPFSPDCPPMPPDDPTSHRLMHCVDRKRGWPHWGRYGNANRVENPNWKAHLPYNEQGEVVLDREGAVQMALLHSREYQEELEALYLSALDVTFERFQFDTQFFGGNETFFSVDGPLSGSAGSSSELSTSTKPEMRRLFATGSQLVVDVANSVVWQFAGDHGHSAFTPLNFSLVQPLLRGAGRAVVLESLTDSERALLANIRYLERFRRDFYIDIVADYLALLEEQVRIRNQESNVSALQESYERLEAAYLGGQMEGQTRYQVDLALQSLLNGQSTLLSINTGYEDQLDAYKITLGLPPELVVGIQDPLLERFNLITPALTATQNAVAILLKELRDRKRPMPADYRDRLSTIREESLAHLSAVENDFEVLLDAVPERSQQLRHLSARPEIRQGAVDPRVCDFGALHRRVVESTTELEGIERAEKRAKQWNLKPEAWEEFKRIELAIQRAQQWNAKLEEGKGELQRWAEQAFGVKLADADLVSWGAVWNARLAEAEEKLQLWAEQWDLKIQKTEMERWENLLQRWEELKQGLVQKLKTTLAAIGQLVEVAPPTGADLDALRKRLTELVNTLSGQLLQLSLVQAGSRLDTITLVPVELAPERALGIARENRRDWMNARAALVDTWRKIEISANQLKGVLDVTVSGDVSTTSDTLVPIHNTTGGLRVGLAFDAPLTRLEERNEYRRTLIAYQQARRDYYAYEDGVGQSLRSRLRRIRLSQLDFEVLRAGLIVAITRVDLARRDLTRPLKPGETSQVGVTAARDLVDALQALLRAQNSFLGAWVSYEIERLNLDLDLGTMQLDGRGMWVDPGPIAEADLPEGDRSEGTPVPFDRAEQIPLPAGEPVEPEGA